MLVPIVSKVLTKVFGSRNDRLLKVYNRRVQQINVLAEDVAKLTDIELRAKTAEFRDRIKDRQRISDIAVEALAVGREVMDRAVGIRNILNPDAGFDPRKLPAQLQPLYAQVRAQADAAPPVNVPGSLAPVPGWMQVEIPVALYDAVRELYPESRPPFRAWPFDVQLIGGMVLFEGKIAEMKTGEGKTIVAPLACYLACLEGLQCHVVTVNDYLVQRDRDWVFPFYYHLGLTVGAIHPFHMQPPEEKKRAYECDVVYGTNSEFGFDYLRDNMKLSPAEQVQKHRDFAIYDEVDSILIDEARTPLIISGPAHEDSPRYELADQIARHLMQKQKAWDAADDKVQRTKMRIKGLEGDIRNTRDKEKIPAWREEMRRLEEDLPRLEAERDAITRYYEIEREKKASHLTHEGIAEAQKIANIGSFYVGANMEFPHLLEQALRAHAVYQRDKDYVVRDGEVIIVDEFTGRLMIGRQWSDGLHQAVEAKEKVKIKQETQTLATITIQNYAKLYRRLAGMTGTAITEATEFNDIYDLDVVCIPTNKPVIRIDRDDLIYLSQKDKWNAILDEIHRHHRLGRPVLVGTTSVENSEMLSAMLTRRHGIKHEVLNAKQHEREAQIVAHAGELGAVMIATNMAGRGTDIKLAPIDRAALVRHWQMTNLLPKEAKPEMSDQQLLELSCRHQAVTDLGLSAKDVAAMSLAEIRLSLLRHWVSQHTFVDPEKAATLSEDQCLRELDRRTDFMLHRLRIYKHVEEMGGLHIVGTERHEARRIDNQLRGRSGRQGDRGSSRFFVSLEDDLMKLFAGKTTLTALSKLGMKEGDAIEHRWITKSVERAQKKVEERNFEIRKNLLEYDEVMEYQRQTFYGIRQAVLEGRDIPQLIFGYIEQAVQDAVALYLADDYVPTQIAEWCRQTLEVSIEPGKLRIDDLAELQQQVRNEAQAEASSVIDVTLGEYMSADAPPEDWDLRGLSSWAMSRFSADLTQTRLRKMSIDEVKAALVTAAAEQIAKKDLSGLAKFLEPHYAQRQLADWAQNKFNLKLDVPDLAKLQPDAAADYILQQARAAYHRREVAYPIEFAMEMTMQLAQQNPQAAAEQLCRWANFRYRMNWTPQDLAALGPQGTYDKLLTAAQEWDASKLETEVDAILARDGDARSPEKLAEWATHRFGLQTRPEELSDASNAREVLLAKGRTMLRGELTQLERFVLLQILDLAWKDHLYAMDQLKDSVGLRGYAERDPRIEYKREGSNQFNQMQVNVRDRVTDLIFRARLTPNVQVRSVYQQQDASQAQARSALDAAAAAASQRGTDQQQADLAAAEQANRSEQRFASRKQRRAAAAREAKETRHERQFKERKRRSR